MENGNHHHYYQQKWQLHHQPQQQQQPFFFPGHLQLYQQHANGLVNDVGEEARVQVVDDGDSDNYFPPGYRFCPTDEELVEHYLAIIDSGGEVKQPPTSNTRQKLHTIPHVDLYSDSPEGITRRYPLGSVDKRNEWYFITPLERKYPNGDRPSRKCGDDIGFWKPTGKDRDIKINNVDVAKKKCLEFFLGKPPHGKKTDWKMHEYKLNSSEDDQSKHAEKNKELCQVLCRIYLNTRKKDKTDEHAQGGGSDVISTEKEIQSETGSVSEVEGGDHVSANQAMMTSFGNNGHGDVHDSSYVDPFFHLNGDGANDPFYENGITAFNFNTNIQAELSYPSSSICFPDWDTAAPNPKRHAGGGGGGGWF